MRNGRVIGVGVCAALFLVTGCGKIAEKSIDQAAQQATGCKNVNVGNGSVSCKGVSVNVKGDGTLPAGFPTDLDPPKNAKIYESSITPGSQGTKDFTVVASIPGDPGNIHTQLKHQLTGAGYTITDDSVVTGTGAVGGSIEATGKTWDVTALFGQNSTGTDDGGTYITLDVTGVTPTEARAETTTSPGSDTTTTTNGSATTPSSTSAGDGSGPGFSVGEGLPAGYPKALAPPAGAKITEALASDGNFQVLAGVSGNVTDVFNAFKHQVVAAGYTISVDASGSFGGASGGTLEASNGQFTLTAVVAKDISGTTGRPNLLEITLTHS